ncbi:MAG: hypothetical protein WAM42_21140, partial [Candidatus Nitrosopolaris sp.]
IDTILNGLFCSTIDSAILLSFDMCLFFAEVYTLTINGRIKYRLPISNNINSLIFVPQKIFG